MTSFLGENPENGDLNQYWYSRKTISTIVDEIVSLKVLRVAFLSTPSIYFSMPQDMRDNSYLFDFDKKWQHDRGFVFFDFNDPEMPSHLLNSFDVVVIDPPFITHEVWRKYADVANSLVVSGGKFILTTIGENSSLLAELLNVSPTAFQPSIPNLVYQYELYTNYASALFSVRNPEIPE